ncbi:MAG TPA: DUF177 domain-containing protein [Actinomycetota bacterium]|nr:DUF177 domain-containing protein [Actinomycetota bacterium]
MQGFTFSVADILDRPGTYRDIRLRERLPEVGSPLARVSDQAITAELRAESVVEGILLTGTSRASVVLSCARCLKDFGGEVRAELCELFAPPGREVSSDADVYEVQGAEIDVEPALRDAVTLSLPLRPLCRDDCKGICAGCGTDLNAGVCQCVDDDVDPRWAQLDALRAKLER